VTDGTEKAAFSTVTKALSASLQEENNRGFFPLSDILEQCLFRYFNAPFLHHFNGFGKLRARI